MLEDLAPWITPALLVALFAWLRADIRRTEDRLRSDMRSTEDRLRSDMRSTEDRRAEMNDMRTGLREQIEGLDGRIDGLDARLRAVEAGLAELRGQLTFIQDYILRRNAPSDEPPGAPENSLSRIPPIDRYRRPERPEEEPS